MNTSIKLNSPCELINVTPLNPLISKCQIKVCWVGDEPNRNGSVITKETALKMANSLPGSPIVGYYNEGDGDFEEHNRIIDISNGKWEIKDTTRPYGFVDLNAQVWFQDYLDDDKIHTYLVTEGYIWTGQYPEANRILVKGNNQSMELDEDSLNAHWAIDDNTGMEFFIINDAVISKLCILGEDVEPCFEGANITKFSLDDEFNKKIYALMKEVRKLKGGSLNVEDLKDKTPVEDEELTEPEVEETEVVEDEAPEANPEVEDSEVEAEESAVEDSAVADEPAEEPANEFAAAEEEKIPEENDKNVEFSLDDFHNLQENYSTLEARYNELQDKYSTLETSYNELVEFKNGKEREEKQAMIDSFSMLSDADKEEVQTNIDKYSVEQIEEKLAVICVRNKLDMSGADRAAEVDTTFNLNNDDDDANESVPALVSALRKAKRNN